MLKNELTTYLEKKSSSLCSLLVSSCSNTQLNSTFKHSKQRQVKAKASGQYEKRQNRLNETSLVVENDKMKKQVFS